jgi:hypothetical protein
MSETEKGHESFPKKTKNSNEDLTKIELIKLKFKTDIVGKIIKGKD